MQDFRLKAPDRLPQPSDTNRARAMASLEAIKAIMESLPLGTEIRSEHVAALLDGSLALMRAPQAREANDQD